jgi:hypothetical protein
MSEEKNDTPPNTCVNNQIRELYCAQNENKQILTKIQQELAEIKTLLINNNNTETYTETLARIFELVAMSIKKPAVAAPMTPMPPMPPMPPISPMPPMLEDFKPNSKSYLKGQIDIEKINFLPVTYEEGNFYSETTIPYSTI